MTTKHGRAAAPNGSRGDHTTGALTVTALAAMVVGSMVGGGIFSLPSQFAAATGVYGTLLAWLIAGAGMLTLAFVFQRLAVARPDLDAGIFAYAKAGFGEFTGFLSAFGYWASACAGNVTYWVLVMATLSPLIPAFGDGNTWPAVIVASVGVWGFSYLVMQGVREAALINRVVTIAKLLPIALFVILCAVALKPEVLQANLTGEGLGAGLFDQVTATMMATVFVFIGVEGASMYSRHARTRADVGRATVLGFLSVLAVLASVTILAYGIMPREEIAKLSQPSTAGVLTTAVGRWGGTLISVGLIISVLGAYLAWTMLAAEILFVAAKDKAMPRFLAVENKHNSPQGALLATAALTQVLLLLTVISNDAFTFILSLTSALVLIPFLLTAGFGIKVATGRDHASHNFASTKHLVIAGLAVVYSVFLIYAAGPKYLLVSAIMYAVGCVWWMMARREQQRPVFAHTEWAILGVILVAAITGIYTLATGIIAL